MGFFDESFSNTGYEPKDYFLTETYVEFNQESIRVYHSQREGLSVGQSSSSMSDRTGQLVVETVAKRHERTGQPVVETGQELNPAHAQIRTLLEILADWQAEIRRHKFQADYDRRSIQKLKNDRIAARRTSSHSSRRTSSTRSTTSSWTVIEAKLGFTWSSREKSQWNGRIEEVPVFHIPHYCKKKISRRSGDCSGALLVRCRSCKMKLIVWTILRTSRMLNQFAVEIPTLPVDQCHSHLIQFLEEC